ncbi:beta-ketoacyl-[acyl-carrier-protein] synthase family protein [Cellulomonas carbonis]|uniref:3-oxoacyl-[acyl-carrier-protein] synthase 2 n=1 Tax=Cellulomonas carbonis T26 TaxID=947969 RepID=A0A0A0BRS0_9CELL|nr:beta-ketoacyl-[acyl-carrier-protein] synthase family protein [Cellulomonas carbonis]KGM10656.1 3-oxoacyl-ACP synthase [Cellulomonas carbonis T26]GGB92276.1 3-oxoacyl-ACP synthase [Cellulomonas carbonis]
MSTARDVVITGMGATTPLGGDVPSTWRAALAGTSGARTLENDWAEKYEIPVSFAAQLAVPATDVLPRPETKRMDPSAQYAVVAAREAWQDAGITDVDQDRLGVVVSSGIGGIWTTLDAWDTLRAKGARRVLPMTVPMLMPNSPTAYVELELGARAGAHALVSACASGAEAIGYGMEMIRTGRADVVVAGGTEAAIHPMPIAAFAASRTLSTRNDDPAAASRPYDTARDGFVLGEGAGVLVLESAEHAAARGARVYARLAGVGLSADGYHMTSPEPSGRGQIAAMRAALQDAAVSTTDVVHVNAHATSTVVGDLIEARSVRAVLGDDADGVALSATKSMTGHLLGGAGALETIFTVLAVHARTAPPTINVDDPDPELVLDLVREPRTLRDGQVAAINNSFGFGGHNVALVVTSA